MKKVIALSIALLPLSSMADVTIYGELNGALENTSHQAGNNPRLSVNKVESYNSSIGFKGGEDLGSGLKAIWQVEQSLQIDGSSSTQGFANRDSFIGLTTAELGTIQAGRLSSFINLNSSIDQWYVSAGVNDLGNRSAGPLANGKADRGGIARFEDRFSNAVAYTSPERAGLSFRALYSAAGETRTASHQELTDAYDLGLKYTNAGFFGLYSYTASQNASPVGAYNAKDDNTKTAAHHLQLGYDANNLLVATEYLQTRLEGTNGRSLNTDLYQSSAVNVNEYKTREAALHLAYTIGAFQPHFECAHGWKDTANSADQSGSDYNQYVLRLNYLFSKRTTAHISAGWSTSGNTDAGTHNFNDHTVAVGLAHQF